jgi:hypothetical protein
VADLLKCYRCECLISGDGPGVFCWSCWDRAGDGGAQRSHQDGCLRRFPASGACSCIQRNVAPETPGDPHGGRTPPNL